MLERCWRCTLGDRRRSRLRRRGLWWCRFRGRRRIVYMNLYIRQHNIEVQSGQNYSRHFTLFIAPKWRGPLLPDCIFRAVLTITHQPNQHSFPTIIIPPTPTIPTNMTNIHNRLKPSPLPNFQSLHIFTYFYDNSGSFVACAFGTER